MKVNEKQKIYVYVYVKSDTMKLKRRMYEKCLLVKFEVRNIQSYGLFEAKSFMAEDLIVYLFLIKAVVCFKIVKKKQPHII